MVFFWSVWRCWEPASVVLHSSHPDHLRLRVGSCLSNSGVHHDSQSTGLSWQHVRRIPDRADTRRHLMNHKHAQVRYTQPISCTLARKTLGIGKLATHEFLMHTLELVKTYRKTRGWMGILHLGYLRNVHEGREESGRARLVQLVKRVVRHVDCGLPHAAAVAPNFPVSPVSTSAKPSLAAFATRSAASWRHHDGARPRCCAPDGEGTRYAE